MVARRVYVPANGNKEKATFPNGQYVDLDVISAAAPKDTGVVGTEAAVADPGVAMTIPPDVPIVVVNSICCRTMRLVADALL